MKVQLEINVEQDDLEATLDALNEQFDVARISHKRIKPVVVEDEVEVEDIEEAV